MRLKSLTTCLVTSELLATTDSTRSLGAMVVVVDAKTSNVVVMVLNVSSSLGAPQLVAITTRGTP
jgi:hypothetical protein